MKKNLNIILITASIITLVIIIVIVVGLTLPTPREVVQGQAEATDYRLSSKIPARVLEIRVKKGDIVSKGDTLVILDAPDINAILSQAQAAYEAAHALEQKARNGARQEQIQGAYATWQKAIAGRDVAQKTYERVNRLFEKGVMPEQKRDEAYVQYQAAVSTEKAAKSQYDMAINGTRHEDVSAAHAQVERAQAAINEVSSYVSETALLATDDGVVTDIFPEVGELVGSGAPIMNVSVINDMWFTFNVREDMLPGLTVGTVIDVYVPSFDKTVKVKIDRVKEVGSFATWKATKALDKYDLKTFEVEAYPVNPDDLKGLRVGMTAVFER